MDLNVKIALLILLVALVLIVGGIWMIVLLNAIQIRKAKRRVVELEQQIKDSHD